PISELWGRAVGHSSIMAATVDPWDLGVLGGYFLCVFAVGLWVRTHKLGGGTHKLGGGTHKWGVGSSLFASNIGSGHFVGLAGTAAASGIAVGGFEWHVGLCRCCLLVDLFSGAVFLQAALGWELYGAVGALLGVTALYTITGGMTALMFADMVQSAVMVGGASVLAGYALRAVGGVPALFHRFPLSLPPTTRRCPIRDQALKLLRPPGGDLPWPGMLLGLGATAGWYWCTDQVIVQRCLSGRSLTHVRGGCVLCGYLKVLPMFLMVLPGMAARLLYPEVVACPDAASCRRACGIAAGCSNVAYPKLVVELLPPGLRGLMLSVVLAALMSSLASILASAGAIFSLDLYGRMRPNASQRRLLMAGRLFMLFLVGVSLAWLPIVRGAQGGRLFDYIQAVGSFLTPPIAALFFLAVFVPRVNEPVSLWGTIGGLWGLWVSMGQHGGPMGLYGVPMGQHGGPMGSIGLYGDAWGELRTQGTEPRPIGAELRREGAELHTEGAGPQSQGAGLDEAPPPDAHIWARVVNINAIIMMAVAIFLWGYFA
uniref:Sodium/glucose cotransporter 2-like n=1 Tax=Coturnix japonica TaxID=93934 RepID=A0A8C2T1P5_COTJA